MIETLITIYGYSVAYSIVTQTLAYSIALAPKLIGKKVANSENKKSATKEIKNLIKNILIPGANVLTGTISLGIMIHPKTRELIYNKMYETNILSNNSNLEKEYRNAKSKVFHLTREENNNKHIEDSLKLEGLDKKATKDIIPTSNEKQLNEEISLVTACELLNDLEMNVSLTNQDKIKLLKPLKSLVQGSNEERNTSKQEKTFNKIINKKMQ